MKVINYWWEDELEELLKNYQENEFIGSDSIKLLILKIIETEKNGN